MMLIADAGSTKIAWVLLRDDGSEKHFTSKGINPLLTDPETLCHTFAEALSGNLGGQAPGTVFYYGAGCIPQIIPTVEECLKKASGASDIHIYSDLLGAARALCGDAPGIACILGTGSNSCLYDGHKIIDAVSPMGYILGDEGSGASIGRRFLSDLFKRQVPGSLAGKFLEQYPLTPAEAIDRVYRRPQPNRFLASLMPFIAEHIAVDYLDQLVTDEFDRFLTRNVENYAGAHSLPVSFTGSIAHNFRPQLIHALAIHNLTLGTLLPSPLPGIITYHQSAT